MSKNVILITLSGRFPSAFTITGLKLTHISTLPVGQTAFNAQWICNAEGFIHCDKPTESQLCRAFWHNISSALIMNTASIYPLRFSGWHHFEYVLFFLLPWKLKSCKWHVHCGGFKKINGQKWNWNIYIQFFFYSCFIYFSTVALKRQSKYDSELQLSPFLGTTWKKSVVQSAPSPLDITKSYTHCWTVRSSLDMYLVSLALIWHAAWHSMSTFVYTKKVPEEIVWGKT